MGGRCVAATSLRCCGGTPGDQDDRGTNELSKIESILGTRMFQNLSRDRRLTCTRAASTGACRVSPGRSPVPSGPDRSSLVCASRADEARKGVSDERGDATPPSLRCLHPRLHRRRAGPGIQFHRRPARCRRCPPWRAKRRRVVPGSREATRDTRRAEGAKGDPKGASERGVQSYGRPVCSRNELAMLWRNAG